MMNKKIKPELNKDIVWKKEGENEEIVSLASYLGGSIQLLNPVASRIVELTDGKHTVQEIIENICNTFEDVDPKKVEKDVEEFLTKLEQKKIIKPLR